MKTLSLIQPWATLVALGAKRIETRSFRVSYRGELAIHASKGFPPKARGFAETERALGRLPGRLPFGAIVAVARLVDVRPTQEVAPEISALERLYGDYGFGRYAWILEDVEMLPEPVPAKGSLGLWTWTP